MILAVLEYDDFNRLGSNTMILTGLEYENFTGLEYYH